MLKPLSHRSAANFESVYQMQDLESRPVEGWGVLLHAKRQPKWLPTKVNEIWWRKTNLVTKACVSASRDLTPEEKKTGKSQNSSVSKLHHIDKKFTHLDIPGDCRSFAKHLRSWTSHSKWLVLQKADKTRTISKARSMLHKELATVMVITLSAFARATMPKKLLSLLVATLSEPAHYLRRSVVLR